jgi:hypothetical protein
MKPYVHIYTYFSPFICFLNEYLSSIFLSVLFQKPADEAATDAAAEPANESEEKPKDDTDETDGDDAQATQTNVTTEETPESVDRDHDEGKDAAVSDENAEPKVADADRSTEEGVEKKSDQAQQPWAVCCGILGPL